jgi:diketogulonate reductase-like aldo/keto reductase
MERRPFDSSDFTIPIIGQGTWNLEHQEPGIAIEALRAGIDLGLTHIDTAEMYGNGAAEELVGDAITDRRDEVFLVSKVLPENASREGTILACERSLRRLGTDHLDVYLLHWRGRHRLEETVAAFEQLAREGKILTWGVSNFDVADLDELWAIDATSGPVCNQVLYHLRERGIEHGVLPWCEQHGLAVVGYSPFGHGDFPAPNSPEGRVLGEIAHRHRATPRQVALRFLTRQAAVFTIPKASTPEHARENAGAGDLRLHRRDLELLEQTFPLGPPPQELPML